MFKNIVANIARSTAPTGFSDLLDFATKASPLVRKSDDELQDIHRVLETTREVMQEQYASRKRPNPDCEFSQHKVLMLEDYREEEPGEVFENAIQQKIKQQRIEDPNITKQFMLQEVSTLNVDIDHLLRTCQPPLVEDMPQRTIVLYNDYLYLRNLVQRGECLLLQDLFIFHLHLVNFLSTLTHQVSNGLRHIILSSLEQDRYSRFRSHLIGRVPADAKPGEVSAEDPAHQDSQSDLTIHDVPSVGDDFELHLESSSKQLEDLFAEDYELKPDTKGSKKSKRSRTRKSTTE